MKSTNQILVSYLVRSYLITTVSKGANRISK